MPTQFRNEHSIPLYTQATESWWLGKSREELDAAAATETNRMRWGRGNVYVSGAAFDGPATFERGTGIRKAGQS